jgi:hypothetical protein
VKDLTLIEEFQLRHKMPHDRPWNERYWVWVEYSHVYDTNNGFLSAGSANTVEAGIRALRDRRKSPRYSGQLGEPGLLDMKERVWVVHPDAPLPK